MRAFFMILSEDRMCQEISHAAAGKYTDESRNHKAVIQDILANPCRT